MHLAKVYDVCKDFEDALVFVWVCGGVLQAWIVFIDGLDSAEEVLEKIEHVIVRKFVGLAQSLYARLQENADSGDTMWWCCADEEVIDEGEDYVQLVGEVDGGNGCCDSRHVGGVCVLYRGRV